VVSISSHDDTYSVWFDSEYDSEQERALVSCLQDDVDAPDDVDVDGYVDMERDGDIEEEEDEEKEDDEKQEKEPGENEEDVKDEDDSKEPQTIGQGEKLNTSADDVDTKVDDQPIVRPEQGQKMHGHTPRPQPPPWSEISDPRPQPRTLETHSLSGLEHLGLVTVQYFCPVVPTLREPETAESIFNVDVDQQLLIELAGGHSLHDIPLPDAPPDGSVSLEGTSPHVAEEVMVVVVGLGLGSCLVCFLCSNPYIPGIKYYRHREAFESLKGYFIFGFCIGYIILVLYFHSIMGHCA